MENGFQVTILDSEAPEGWNFDWTLVWPSIWTYVVFGSIGQFFRKLGHKERPKLDKIHYNRLKRHYNFIFCDSVSRQMFDMENQIFFKNMKGKGNISWRDTRVTPSDTCDTAFLAHFLKIAFFSYFSWTGPNGYISPSETAVLKQLCDQILNKNFFYQDVSFLCSHIYLYCKACIIFFSKSFVKQKACIHYKVLSTIPTI